MAYPLYPSAEERDSGLAELQAQGHNLRAKDLTTVDPEFWQVAWAIRKAGFTRPLKELFTVEEVI